MFEYESYRNLVNNWLNDKPISLAGLYKEQTVHINVRIACYQRQIVSKWDTDSRRQVKVDSQTADNISNLKFVLNVFENLLI